tara:strand:+ start:8756 stop:9679 length:924 start_codon:yes stop_codon:yes gene_type:complete
MSKKNKNELLKDIKSAAISEMISHEFYSKSSTSVKLISGMHAFQEMMWEEEKHVNRLKEEYKNLGGSGDIKYDPQKYGGLALPKLDVDAVIALNVARNEETSSIKMYNEFLKKHKETKSAELFKQLLRDEKKHLDQWNEIAKSILSSDTVNNEANEEVYRFSKEDLNIIQIALAAERSAYDFYKNAGGKMDTIDGAHAFQHMAWEEGIHVKRLEDEYYRLVNKKPPIEKPVQKHTTKFKKKSDALVALELSIKEEKASLQRYLDLEEKCTNTRLKEVIWELIENEWDHISQWRNTRKSIKENDVPLF